MTRWQQWMSQPQTTWLRKTIFQLHLWTGIGAGLYLLLVSVTGSIVVFRNELYTAATPDPIIVAESGPLLNDEELASAAARTHPGFKVVRIIRARNPSQAVTVSLKGGSDLQDRLLDPYSGADLGDSVPLSIWLVSKLIELHDDLLAGRTGRRLNGVGAVVLLVLAFTGAIVWWPGTKTWRRSVIVPRHVGWRRFTWHLHSTIGFWSLGFILVFGLSGAYLGNPGPFQALADRLEPPTDANAGTRTVDQILYWLAYAHFGRINGRGIPCSGRGICDWTTKFIWALFGLAPAAMFVTGALMWWNRVLRRGRRPKGGAIAAADDSHALAGYGQQGSN